MLLGTVSSDKAGLSDSIPRPLSAHPGWLEMAQLSDRDGRTHRSGHP